MKTHRNFSYKIPEINVSNFKVTKYVNLQQKHLDDLTQLRAEVKELDNNIVLHPLVHIMHISIIIIIISMTVLVIYVFRNKIINVLKKEESKENEVELQGKLYPELPIVSQVEDVLT